MIMCDIRITLNKHMEKMWKRTDEESKVGRIYKLVPRKTYVYYRIVKSVKRLVNHQDFWTMVKHGGVEIPLVTGLLMYMTVTFGKNG